MESRRIGNFWTACFALIPALLSGCAQPGPDTSGNSVTNERQLSAPDMDSINNVTFAGIHDYPLTLAAGRWEGEPFQPGGASRPTAGLAKDFYLSADVDGDGRDEAVVILWENSGGSGNYTYVAVVGWRDGKATNIGTAQIGDRVQIRGARFDGQHIILNVVQQGPHDATCCPSQKATRTWSMRADELQEGGAVVDGALSTDDFEGKTWRLVAMGHDEPTPQSAAVTLVFDDFRLSGKGPCNHYFAKFEPGDYPGSIEFSQAGATEMACQARTMELERKYFQALSGVNRYSFSMGRLALTWAYEEQWNTMLFEVE